MTEIDWLACTDPKQMVEYLRANRKMSDRKLRLFAVACVQRYSSVDGAMREIVRVSELYADALAGWIDLASMRKLALEFQRQAMRRNVGMGAGAVRHAASVASPSAFAAAQGVLLAVVPDVALHAISEVFGNPFRPVALDRTWLTPTVVNLSNTIYDNHGFQDLPILADSLEKAGCTNADILSHCRHPGPHFRGCWVVDMLLRKS